MHRHLAPLTAALLFSLWAGSTAAGGPVVIEIKDQAFMPQEFTVPAGVKVQLVVKNDDALPAEFESYDLSREIVVPAHDQVKVYIGPLDPGRYRFFNDFHQASQGWVVAAPVK